MVSVVLAFINTQLQRHEIEISAVVEEFDPDERSSICLEAKYCGNDPGIPVKTLVAEFGASYEARNEYDDGFAKLGGGRIDINIPQLRGIGLGSILMIPLIQWLQLRPDVPMSPISLSADDAATSEARDRRNKFYEKLGFTFEWKDAAKSWGDSERMPNSKLIAPNFRAGMGWSVQRVSKTPTQPGSKLFDIESLLLNLG